MPDGSDRNSVAGLETELSSVVRINQNLARAFDQLIENGDLDKWKADRILGALDTLPPEDKQRMIDEAAYCTDQRTGITPLIDRVAARLPEPAPAVAPPKAISAATTRVHKPSLAPAMAPAPKPGKLEE